MRIVYIFTDILYLHISLTRYRECCIFILIMSLEHAAGRYTYRFNSHFPGGHRLTVCPLGS